MARTKYNMPLAEYVQRFATYPEAAAALGITLSHLRELMTRRKNPSFEVVWKIWVWTAGRVTPAELLPKTWNVPAPICEHRHTSAEAVET